MTPIMSKGLIIGVISIIAIGSVMAVAGARGTAPRGQDAPQRTNDDMTVPLRTDMVALHPEIAALPAQDISDVEKAGLLQMREEEKLAHDVYVTLYDQWELPIFSNIARSEQTHTDAVKALLEKYAIADPVTDSTVGVFTSPAMAQLYTDLTARGSASLNEALTVGALIEDLDIADLQKHIAQTDNDDIRMVYENLTRGSRNHIRSFTSQLVSRGGTYTPQYITQDEYDAMIATPREPGTGMGGGGMRGGGRGMRGGNGR